MPDIRSFFGPKGGGPAPSKPVVQKETDNSPKNRRGKGRNVVEDSDDDDDFEPAIPQKKPSAAAASRKKPADEPVKGIETTASAYFASKAAKPSAAKPPPKASPVKKVKSELEVRVSPRTKAVAAAAAAKAAETPTKNGRSKRAAATTYAKYDEDEDSDAYKDEDEDDEDIFAADIKGRGKRKNDDYEEESDEDLPKPKRRAVKGAQDSTKTTPAGKTSAKASPAAKKRKSPVVDSDEDEDEMPRKKPAASKPRAPRAQKAPEAEHSSIQKILDDIPTVRPPTPPPREPGAKFDWAKRAGGAAAVANPTSQEDLPVGEDECLTGLAFVFTGVLNTVDRDTAQALVKRYGGKVTGAPSSKTSYVVLGTDAGPSKLEKIKKLGIKTIDEHGLFELIRRLPAYGGGGKAAEKARDKQQEKEELVRKQAAEMEAEEKARAAAAAKAAQKAAAARGVSAPAQTPTIAQLWTTKYAPTSLSHICGNKANVEKIQSWLRNWQKSKKYNFVKKGADGTGGSRAIIISGPPGIGKTTAAHLAAKLEGYDVLESNASDTRSKKLVEAGLSDVMNNTSLLGYFAGDGKKVDTEKKKIVLIMDEVDGMSAGDRGGVGALAKFCKKTEIPLILICNERRLPKMAPFNNVAFDIKFIRPTVEMIRSRVMTICHREGLKLPPPVVDALIEGSGKDIRQIINMLSTIKLDQTSMDFEQGKAMTKSWEKHVILKPWDICQKLLGGGLFSPSSKATLNDKIELYFNDHEFSFLMIQENYLRTKPAALSNKGYNRREENLKYLELVDSAAASISDGDLVDRMIHGPQQHWSLMPTHAIFSTVRPCSYVAGQMLGSQFTSWLGNNSKASKLGRYVREIHSHMRLKSSGDHNEVRQQYLPVLWDRMIRPLDLEGPEAVDGVIDLMDSYFLTREDFDCIMELGVGPQDQERVGIATQTKSAFTRIYNKRTHPVPFMKASSAAAAPIAAKVAPDLEEAIEEEEEVDVAEAVEVDDEADLKNDKYIKKPKAKPAKKARKSKGDEDEDEDDVEEESAPKKGRSRTATGKGKGKK